MIGETPPVLPCLTLVFDIRDDSQFYKFEILKSVPYLFQTCFLGYYGAHENDDRHEVGGGQGDTDPSSRRAAYELALV
jgi:hypothetical protein